MLGDLKADHLLQQGEELAFWQERLAEATQGGAKLVDVQREIQTRIADLLQESYRQYDEANKREEEAQLRHGEKMAAIAVEWTTKAREAVTSMSKEFEAQNRIG